MPLGNGNCGINISEFSGATTGMIGGLAAGEGNIIAFNALNGISDSGANGPNSWAILGNSIHDNGALGITLQGCGTKTPTPNDPGDTDTGANNLQNYPVITSVSISGGTLNVAATLNSAPNTTYRVEFFANGASDPSGFGEGQIFLGFKNVTTDSTGNISFTASFPQPSGGQRLVTATATDPAGNTSEFSASVGQLLNISTRMRVQTGENVLIGGFIITGTDPKRVLTRAIGPSLSQFFSGVLADPTLQLFQGSTLLQSNDDWKTDQQAEIVATGIPPTNDLESAIVRTLAPGAYTAIVSGKNNSTGIALVEAYDLDQAANSKLANISTRGFVESGNNVMIGGFIVGNGIATVVVRAIGPSLANAGVTGALQDPTLDFVDSNGTTLRSNDNWKLGGQQTELTTLGLQPSDDRESALIQTVGPGNYTAIVRGAGNTTGVGLVEVYNVQ
jgi:hypothetical protein